MQMNSNTIASSIAASSGVSSQNLAKEKYRSLKRKFKFLVYENECYQEELRNLQRRLLKLSRDKNFLLDRLMQYEKVSDSSDDSEPSTPAVKNSSESPKPKKKKSYPSKKAKAKQQQMGEQLGQPVTMEGSASSSTSVPIPATIPSNVRSRPKKGTANGASSSSDLEPIGMTSTVLSAMGTVTEMERPPIHMIQHYPSVGVYEQQLPHPPVLGND